MCRWLAYSGSPILLRDALYSPAHSLIDRSLQSRLGSVTANGDGFGIGWYGTSADPALFRSVDPPSTDPNLRELAGHISTSLFFTHIRATSGTAVQRTNCHPFRHGKWLWMHNGVVDDFSALKRDLVLDVDPSLFPYIEGQTDSEVLFFLALTLGLDDDPQAAVSGAVGLVEAAARRRRVTHPFDGTIATTDGRRIWVFRYASAGRARSLFVTRATPTLRRMYPQLALLGALGDDACLVVSEPLGVLPGAWQELPEASCAMVSGPDVEIRPFVPPRSPRPYRPTYLAGAMPR
jgi:predicted glutamine amidotransferase